MKAEFPSDSDIGPDESLLISFFKVSFSFNAADKATRDQKWSVR